MVKYWWWSLVIVGENWWFFKVCGLNNCWDQLYCYAIKVTLKRLIQCSPRHRHCQASGLLSLAHLHPPEAHGQPFLFSPHACHHSVDSIDFMVFCFHPLFTKEAYRPPAQACFYDRIAKFCSWGWVQIYDGEYVLKWTVAQKCNLSERALARTCNFFRGERIPIGESPKKFVPLVPP